MRRTVAQPHTHTWATVDFGIAEGRPMVRQHCACGTERQVRAFDRTWHPPQDIRQGGDGTLEPVDRSGVVQAKGDATAARSAQ